jgi:LPS export ABC transporter protein LptC
MRKTQERGTQERCAERSPLLRSCAFVLCVIAACSKAGPDRIEQVAQAADSADQLMIGMSTNLTAEGVRTGHLEADSAFVYEASGHTDLKKIKVTFYTPSGVQTSVLTAETGWYQTRTGAMEARGNVVIVRTSDGARLTTSIIKYDQSKNQVTTDQPYTTDQGDKHFTGTGFVSDPTFSNVVSQGIRGTGGHFTLPGQ